MLSTAQTVLSTPELLAEILSWLDMRTLLLSQRVSRQWRDLIAGTPALQRALFIEPVAATSSAELVRDRKRNPLLQEVFRPFFKENVKAGPGGTNDVTKLEVKAGSRPFAFMDDSSDGKDDTGNENDEDGNKDRCCSSRRRAFLRKGASWRRMLVQQPAAPKLGFVEQIGMFEQTYSNACFPAGEPDGGDGGGLRMGALYDFVYQFMGDRRARHEKHAFSVYWREPEYDRPVHKFSRWGGREELALKALGDDVVVVVVRVASHAEEWQVCGVTERSALREDYLPEEWEGKDVDLKHVNSECWFG